MKTTEKSTSNLAQEKGKKRTKSKNNIVEFKNVERNFIYISESILRNFLKDWHEKMRANYEVKKKKVEKISISLAILGIIITLWSTILTVSFDNDFVKALYFFFATAFSLAFIICVVIAIRAHRAKEEELDLEELIKSIEKRTE